MATTMAVSDNKGSRGDSSCSGDDDGRKTLPTTWTTLATMVVKVNNKIMYNNNNNDIMFNFYTWNWKFLELKLRIENNMKYLFFNSVELDLEFEVSIHICTPNKIIEIRGPILILKLNFKPNFMSQTTS